MPEVIQQI
nr:unnamed protein product [Callosobruchus analis]